MLIERQLICPQERAGERGIMLNYLWAAMIAIGIIYAVFTGNLEAITNAALDSAGEGISLCITTAGVMALWMGLMEIAGQSGLVAKLTKGIGPVLTFLFPRIPKEHKAREYIATNMIANVLGLGWACTPAGLKAMEELAHLEQERGNPEYREDMLEGEAGAGRDSGRKGGSRTASKGRGPAPRPGEAGVEPAHRLDRPAGRRSEEQPRPVLGLLPERDAHQQAGHL